MHFHVLDVLTFYGNTDQIDAFHASMFHGRANRGGAPPTSRDYRLAFDVDRPLVLHKNAYDIADVFTPAFGLVISSAVRTALSDVPNVKFQPVSFATLFNFPYKAGDFSFWDEIPDYNKQQQFIDEQEHNPEHAPILGEYYELVSPPIKDLRGSFDGLQEVSIEIGPTEFDDPLEIDVSEEMLTQVPVFSCGSFIMNDRLFARIREFIDWTYFTHTESKL